MRLRRLQAFDQRAKRIDAGNLDALGRAARHHAGRAVFHQRAVGSQGDLLGERPAVLGEPGKLELQRRRGLLLRREIFRRAWRCLRCFLGRFRKLRLGLGLRFGLGSDLGSGSGSGLGAGSGWGLGLGSGWLRCGRFR